MKSRHLNQKGMTLVELILVITVLGIIMAAVLPAYTNIKNKSALKMDIKSTQTLQYVIDMYKMEQPEGLPSTKEELYTDLLEKEYLKKQDLTPDQQEIRLQTKDASIKYSKEEEQVQLSVPNDIDLEKYGVDEYDRTWIDQ